MAENFDQLLPDAGENNEISMTKTEEVRARLREDKEVKALANSIDISNQVDLLEFGKEPAIQISRFSDRILSMISSTTTTDSGEMLNQLGKVMDRFDKNDFGEPRGLAAKLFKRNNSVVEKIFQKYQSLGGEIEKVNIEIARFEDEMVKTTQTLEEMYESNFDYYMELEKYVVAGQIKIEELKSLLPDLKRKAAAGGQLEQLELETLENGIQALSDRVYDLDMARMVALQTAPQIRTLQRGNMKLIGKINSAFIITIPIFKTGVIQAVTAKRQKLIADSMSELDRRTNDMLKQNAVNIAGQSAEIARLSGKPSIEMDTIEESWNTIVNGMKETLAIEQENNRLRDEGMKRILELQDNMRRIEGS